MSMSPSDLPAVLQAMRQLWEQATKTPWRREGDWVQGGDKFYDEVITPAPVECMAYCYGGSSRIDLDDADAVLLLSAVNGLPALIEHAKAVRARHRKEPGSAGKCSTCRNSDTRLTPRTGPAARSNRCASLLPRTQRC